MELCISIIATQVRGAIYGHPPRMARLNFTTNIVELMSQPEAA
jgi:hypothetical protein